LLSASELDVFSMTATSRGCACWKSGLFEPDQLYLHPELQKSTEIGIRPIAKRRSMPLSDRIRRNLLRQRRKRMAIRSFVQAWGLRNLLRVLLHWPRAAYFR